jgi:hypothetical protein
LRNLNVQEIVRRFVHFRVACWILLASEVGLLGCPQLLDDRFATDRLSQPDAGGLCLDAECDPSPFGGLGGQGGSAGMGGSDAGTSSWGGGDDRGGYGSRGSSGDWGGSDWGSSGSAGSSSAGAGGSAGSGAASACRTIELASGIHDASSNCVGIVGWNDLEVETPSPTTLSLSYQDGDPCFTGSMGSGWAVYDLMFAPDGEEWNATTHAVTGFEFASRGSSPPASLRVLYKDSGGVDFCRMIAPGVTTVPFSDAHPNCSTSASASSVDTADMVEIILDFVPASSQPYAVDFCLQITALD